MNYQFQSLAEGEVLSVDESQPKLIGHCTFKVGEFADALKQKLLQAGIGELAAWFSTEGVACEVLKFGASDWQHGRVRVNLEFRQGEASVSLEFSPTQTGKFSNTPEEAATGSLESSSATFLETLSAAQKESPSQAEEELAELAEVFGTYPPSSDQSQVLEAELNDLKLAQAESPTQAEEEFSELAEVFSAYPPSSDQSQISETEPNGLGLAELFESYSSELDLTDELDFSDEQDEDGDLAEISRHIDEELKFVEALETNPSIGRESTSSREQLLDAVWQNFAQE